MTAGGTAVVAWVDSARPDGGTVYAAVRPSGGAFSAPQLLAPVGSVTSVDSYPDAPPAVGWTVGDPRFGPLETWRASLAADGSFAAAQHLFDFSGQDGPFAYDGLFAVGSGGEVLATASSSMTEPQWNRTIRCKPADGPFGDPVPLLGTEGPPPMLDGAGVPLVFDSHSAPNGNTVISERSCAGRQTVGPETGISDPANDARPPGWPSFATDHEGDVVAAWATFAGGHAPQMYAPDIEFAVRRAGQPFGSSRVIGVGSQVSEPTVAVDAQGDALIVWPDASGLKSVFAPAGGPPGAPRAIPESADVHTAGGVAAGFDSRGHAIVAWSSDAAGGHDPRLMASISTAGGEFQPPDTLFEEPPASYFSLNFIRLAFDAAGRGIAVWSSRSDERVYAAPYDAAALGTAAPLVSGLTLRSDTARPAVSYLLRAPARVRVIVQWAPRGVRAARSSAHKSLVDLRVPGHRGYNSVLVSTASRRLRPGRYTITVIAVRHGRRVSRRITVLR